MNVPRCHVCAGLLGLLEEAALAGMRFTVAERKVLMEKCKKSMEESTAVLASRGYTLRNGRWEKKEQI